MQKSLVFLIWMVVWELLSRLTNNSILLVGPFETAVTLSRLLPDSAFWSAICLSLLHIGCGFLLALLAGILLGLLSCRFAPLSAFLSPPVSLMKSVPVASFVILALIWLGSSRFLSTFVSFVVVFPMVYLSTQSGVQSTDRDLLEFGAVYRLSAWKKLRYLYLPALFPYLISCLRTAVGLCWKSGIAAELIGQPRGTIGSNLYSAKIFLDTGSVFAWTAAIICICRLTEWLILHSLLAFARRNGRPDLTEEG